MFKVDKCCFVKNNITYNFIKNLIFFMDNDQLGIQSEAQEQAKADDYINYCMRMSEAIIDMLSEENNDLRDIIDGFADLLTIFPLAQIPRLNESGEFSNLEAKNMMSQYIKDHPGRNETNRDERLETFRINQFVSNEVQAFIKKRLEEGMDKNELFIDSRSQISIANDYLSDLQERVGQPGQRYTVNVGTTPVANIVLANRIKDALAVIQPITKGRSYSS
jgi:hypothetical protein